MTDKKTGPGSDKKLTNQALREKYEEIYSQGEEKYFSKFNAGVNQSEANEYVLALANWVGKSVVDIGCGTGELLRQIAERDASELIGIDYSQKAIDIARSRDTSENTRYVAGDISDIPPTRKDIVISCGTIEHSNVPSRFLETLSNWCKDDGCLIVTCPHFINIRGFVWMALSMLQEVPMSLTDLHSIHPWHMERWCGKSGLKVREFTTCDYERANGEGLPRDFNKRLHNALRDAGIDNANVPKYIDHLAELVEYLDRENACKLQGATAIYVMEKIAE